MCVEAKTNRDSLVSPDLNPIEQLLDESGDASGIVQCNLGIFGSLTFIKNGRGFPRLYDVICFQFDLVMMQLLLQERFMFVF